jgi:hypothetical protein
MIKKAVKDGTKLRKVSTGVQIWTRLDRSRAANLAAIARPVAGNLICVVYQVPPARSFPRIVLGVFQ